MTARKLELVFARVGNVYISEVHDDARKRAKLIVVDALNDCGEGVDDFFLRPQHLYELAVAGLEYLAATGFIGANPLDVCRELVDWEGSMSSQCPFCTQYRPEHSANCPMLRVHQALSREPEGSEE